MKPIPIQTVNQRIQEPQRALSHCEARIIQQSHKSGESGRRRRRATNAHRAPFEEYPKPIRLCRDVWDPLDDRYASTQSKTAVSSPLLSRDNRVRVRVLGG
jgi:hypothetical protein